MAHKGKTDFGALITAARDGQAGAEQPSILVSEQLSKQVNMQEKAKLEPFGTYLPPDLIRRLKVHAVTRDEKIQDVVAQALETLLRTE